MQLFPRDIVHTLGQPVVEAGMVVFRRTAPTADVWHALRHATALLAIAPNVCADLAVRGASGLMSTVEWTLHPGDAERLVRAVRDEQSRQVVAAVVYLADRHGVTA